MPCLAIVGGGLGGLSVAYELTRRGHSDFVLFETTARLGGIVETVRKDGFVIECGPDSWVAEKPWARELAIELGLEAEIIPSQDAHRRTYLLQENKLVPLPGGMRMMVSTDLEAIQSSPLFSEAARRAYCEEPSRAAELKAFAAARSASADESVATFVERHFGAEVTNKIAAPLLAGVFGGDIRQLSASAVMANLVELEREHGSLVLGLQKNEQARPAAAVFATLKGGLQTLVDAMASRLPSATIHCNEPVISAMPESGRWTVTTSSSRSSFDRIVLATPAHISRDLIAHLDDEDSRELKSLLQIEATSSVVVAFAFDLEASRKLTIPEGFGFLVSQIPTAGDLPSEPKLLACTFVDQKFSHRAPEGCILLRAFYGGDSASPLLQQSDSAILALTRRNLANVFGELPEPQLALARRWPSSLPQYTVGHRARVARIEQIVAGIPGLQLVGNAFHGVGLPDLVRRGRAVAGKLLQA